MAKSSSAMAQVYANLIKEGTVNPKTGKPYAIEDVPETIRPEVEAILAGDEDAE